MKKIITLGGAMLDLFIQQEALPCSHAQQGNKNFLLLEIGKKLEINSIEKQSGGGATNAAVSFSRLGLQTKIIGKVGADCEGDFIIAELKKNGVNTDHLLRSTTDMTGLSIIIPCPAGERTVLAYRGANISLQGKEIPTNLFDTSDALYITSLTGSSAALLLPITRHAKKQGCIVATNPGTSQLVRGTQTLLESLPNIDIFILNSFEAQECMRALTKQLPSNKTAEISVSEKNKKRNIPAYEKAHALASHAASELTQKNLPALLRKSSEYHTPDFGLRNFFAQILSHGPQVVAVTNGAEGVYVAQGDTIYFHPGLATNVVSTIGAGDAFGSCFVASLLQEKSVPEALIRGITNASSVIGSVGAKTGLLAPDELEKRMNSVGLQQLKRFTR
ncbi:carbohydrate kinase [Candidatus Dependentiae bacterium HGW-Dependentiae-1]|nr:MAG: carbohydrate kinase [Candidatus Dependentiae bacterium HGW-Dependentiae-1]